MNTITANDVKRHGVASITKALESAPEAIISVRGKNTYVVMDIQEYQRMREYEIEGALREAQADLEAGRIIGTSVSEHIAGLRNE